MSHSESDGGCTVACGSLGGITLWQFFTESVFEASGWGGSQITLAARCCSLVINKIKVNQKSRENWNAVPYGRVSAKHICTGNIENVKKKNGNGSDGKSIFYFVLKSGVINITLETWVKIHYSETRAILNCLRFCTTTDTRMLICFEIITACLFSKLCYHFSFSIQMCFLLQEFFSLSFHSTPLFSASLAPFLYGMNVVTSSSFSLSDPINREILLHSTRLMINTIKVDVRGVRCRSVGYLKLVQDKVECPTRVNMAINFRVPYKENSFFTS